jgi:CubicO group peptidase (beta-lactamase class C family)
MPRVPRIPGVPDPLRRIPVPRDLDSVTSIGAESPAGEGGMTEDGVERIWKDAVSLYRSGVHPAVQVCVRREGAVVLDRAIGHASGNGPSDSREGEQVLATPGTPYCVYSASKAITAFVVHKLIERGDVRIDAPVLEYIPEYGAHGKEGITIGHVLAHRAGVPNLPREVLGVDNIGDRELLVNALVDAKPFAKPGRLLAYHAVSGGFILGEVVHRVTGKDIRQVLGEEFLEPLGFRWTNYGVAAEDLPQVGLNYVTGPRLLPPLSNLLTRALGARLDEVTEIGNDPTFLTGIVPAANTVTTANELSRFYELMRRGGELDGVRVLEPDTIRHALTEQSHLEVDLSLGFPTRFSYGLMLGAQRVSLYGPDTQHAFGHLGFTNILAWADPERALACAVITSGKPTVYPEMPRFFNLPRRIGREAPKVEGSALAF